MEAAKMAEGVVDAMREAVKRALEPVRNSQADIVSRLATVEAREPIVGERGPAGENGIDGKDGAPGLNGERGETGERGERGEKGEPGADGARGEDGRPGVDGEKGVTGERGERGPAGERGEPGPPGADAVVDPGQLMLAVADAVKAYLEANPPAAGPQGETGRDGLPGQKGDAGRDAAHLEVLPAIDPSKSYPRNTYARHENGFWRSFETTDGMKGWECLVAGVKSIEAELGAEGRTVTVRAAVSDGHVVAHTLTVPAMIYRQIFVEGTEYAPGDVVTWGGSAWHCEEATTEKPGTGKAWKLAVKRGADGKEGPAGKNGADGRNGRDLVR